MQFSYDPHFIRGKNFKWSLEDNQSLNPRAFKTFIPFQVISMNQLFLARNFTYSDMILEKSSKNVGGYTAGLLLLFFFTDRVIWLKPCNIPYFQLLFVVYYAWTPATTAPVYTKLAGVLVYTVPRLTPCNIPLLPIFPVYVCVGNRGWSNIPPKRPWITCARGDVR